MLSDLKFNALILHKMALSRPYDEINYHLFLAFSIKHFLNSKYQNFVVKYMFHGDNLKLKLHWYSKLDIQIDKILYLLRENLQSLTIRI